MPLSSRSSVSVTAVIQAACSDSPISITNAEASPDEIICMQEANESMALGNSLGMVGESLNAVDHSLHGLIPAS